MILQNDVREKEERKKREKEERIRKEKEELKKNLEYNPFGKAGAGAPLKDH
jgi:centrosome and spindle pole-associated protein 1